MMMAKRANHTRDAYVDVAVISTTCHSTMWLRARRLPFLGPAHAFAPTCLGIGAEARLA
jgi:hypothetical protein